MAITTYAELQSAVADFLNRDDLTSVIPTFIDLAEAQMQRTIRHHKMMQRAEGLQTARLHPSLDALKRDGTIFIVGLQNVFQDRMRHYRYGVVMWAAL